jgi:hypothetical protein
VRPVRPRPRLTVYGRWLVVQRVTTAARKGAGPCLMASSAPARKAAATSCARYPRPQVESRRCRHPRGGIMRAVPVAGLAQPGAARCKGRTAWEPALSIYAPERS